MNRLLDTYKVKFKIKKVRMKDAKTNFTVLDADIQDYNRLDEKEEIISPISSVMTIKGNFKTIKEGDIFEGIARLRYDRKYGSRFLDIPNPRLVKLEFEEEVSSFIQRRCKSPNKSLSVGKKTADKIVETLGLSAISMILKDKNVLKAINGLTDAKIDFIYEELSTSEKYEELLTFLETNGLRTSLAGSIYQEFKDTSIIKIRENPYVLYKILSEEAISFKEIDRLGQVMKFEFTCIERISAGILYYVDYRVKSNGDLYIVKEDIYENLYEFLLKQGCFELPKASNNKISKELFETCFEENLLDQSISLEINSKGETCVYRKKYKYIENNIIKSLKKLISGNLEPFCLEKDIDEFIDMYQNETGFTLAKNQKKAIYMALTNGFSIMTGGPGTGKTATTNCIIKCIRYVNPDASILLLAPTGKASKRLEELCKGEKAQTIHRGLKLNPLFTKKMKEDDILTHDFVLVDEASMVGAELFSSLLERISDNTRIILVGDSDQLPSVDAGLILRDLIDSNKVPVTRLNELFRQAQESQIVTNSHKVISGKSDLEMDTKNKSDFYFWNSSTVDLCKERVIECFRRCLEDKGYDLSEICILSPMKNGELGTIELNKAIQSRFNKSNIYYKMDNMNMIKVGDRVMQTTNNYDLEVFNGEIGEVSNITVTENDVSIQVYYGQDDNGIDRRVIYSKKELPQLVLAYCITIHKSQGSEFPAVICVVSDQHISMLNRNLVYTAWTRAKKVVLNVGQMVTLEKCIPRMEHMTRNSRIIEKLNRTFN